MDNQVFLDESKSSKANRDEIISAEQILTPPIVELIEKFKEETEAKGKGETATIHVDEIASKIAHLYEVIRKVVDWKEENVLRRSAILRILKRSFINKISEINLARQSSDVNQIAENLTLELIRGGHLPNDEVPTEKIPTVASILSKYLYILEKAPFHQSDNSFILKKKINFYDWLLEIAACEIEDVLAQPFKENALIKAMTLLMFERIRVIPQETLDSEKKQTLVYIAVCRTLFDLDDDFISYHLLAYRYREWINPSPGFLSEITQNIFNIHRAIEADLNYPLSREFFNVCERIDTVFTLFGDLLDHFQKDPEKINQTVKDKKKFKELLTQFYEQRIKTLKKRLFRLAIFSTLSVFLSNWVTYFIIEVPVANLFYEGFSLVAAITDFLVPSIFMFVLVAIIKPPSPSNLEVAIKTTFEFVYGDSERELYEIKIKKRNRPIFGFIIAILYLIGTIISFGAIAWVFYIAKIPITSVFFDTMTISLNVFAALVIRNKARELTVQEKTSSWEFLLDYLSIPIARVGNFLADKWKEYNLASVFFNFFIELPFIYFIEFVESWSQFLKQQKADIH